MMQLLLLILLFNLEAFAQKQVTLLVSITGETRVFFSKQDTTKRLVDQFRQHYPGIDLPLKIIGNAHQEDLHRELMNPENDAVFWVSHANSFGNDEALGGDDTIIDVEGNNVKHLFQMIHPSIKFVAVLGCRTAPIIEDFKRKGFYQDNNDLVVYARDKKIDGGREMKKALRAYRELSQASTPLVCPERTGYPLKISRTIAKGEQGSSIKIMNREKFLGLLPPGSPGETQDLIVYLPTPKTAQDLKILVDAGRSQLSIRSDAFEGEWNVFADATGKPIGVRQNIFRYSGTLRPKSLPEAYFPYKCD